MVHRGAEEEAFDRDFWARMDPGEKLELLWDMVLEADVWKGGDGSEPRLQRSVCRLILNKRKVGRPHDNEDLRALEDEAG
jgi:hypothetical protein